MSRLKARNAVSAILPVIALTAGLAGCGSTANTPAAAVRGFVNGLRHSNAKAACANVVPIQRPSCEKPGELIRLTGTVTIARTFIDGTNAIVASVGTACVTAPSQRICGSNEDPEIGLPNSKASFSQAFTIARHASGGPNTPDFWAQSVTKIKGHWYVYVG